MKIKQINKKKYTIFEEQDLIQKLSMNEADRNIVLDYQLKFPELLQDEDGFCVDGEILCNQLGVGSNFNDWLLANRKGKEGKLIRYRCVENTDFTVNREVAKNPKGGRPTNKIMLTLNCAKKIAMRQNNEQGDLVCDYFILMESTLRNYEKWINAREPQKENANILKSELKKWACKNHMNADFNGLYAREFNMLNKNLVGKTALEIKMYLGYKDIQTREHLNTEINKALDFIQQFDINLLKCNESFEQRDNKIKIICENSYKELFNILK